MVNQTRRSMAQRHVRRALAVSAASLLTLGGGLVGYERYQAHRAERETEARHAALAFDACRMFDVLDVGFAPIAANEERAGRQASLDGQVALALEDIAKGDYLLAQGVISSLPARGASAGMMRLLLATLALEQGQPQAAVTTLENSDAPADWQGGREAWHAVFFAAAVATRAAGLAEQHLLAIEQAEPQLQCGAVLRRRAMLEGVRGRWLQAQQLFEQEIRIQPSFRSRFDAADASARAGDLAGAIQRLQTALTQDESQADGHAALALLQLRTGELTQATQHATRAIELAPRGALSCAARAEVARSGGASDEALRFFACAAESAPHNANYVFKEGLLLAERGRWSDAEVKFRRATALDPELSQAWNGLGVTLMRLSRNDEARASFVRAQELDPADPNPSRNLALL